MAQVLTTLGARISTMQHRYATLWRELVVENPMAIEISRFRRRFLEGGRGKTVNTMVMVVAILAYATLLLVIANMSGDFPPVALVYLQTAIFCLLAPALMYSSISGERERRTWDLLLAAPITHAQIIVGKFLAALSGIGAGFLLFFLPTMFTAVTYHGDFAAGSTMSAISGTGALVLEEAVSLTFAICLSALTLFFSARCRRSLMALGIVLSVVFLTLIAFPALIGSFAYGDFSNDLLSVSHPIFAIARIEDFRRVAMDGYSAYGSFSGGIGPIWYGIPQIVLYVLFTGVFLVWSLKTVSFADGEKKFIPRKKHA